MAIEQKGPSTTIYLVRHAESIPDPDVPEPDWQLSRKGREQAQRLAIHLQSLEIDYIFSSPYPRAIDTVRPFAKQSGLEVIQVDDLREKKLRETPLDDFWDVMKKAWRDLDFAFPNCESGTDCQRRIVAAIDTLVAEHAGSTFIAISHGNAIGLFLNSLDSSFGYNEWRAMKNPDIFKITHNGQGYEWDKAFMFILE
jgi:2,3-bisphosphoglycerate-dependent phosphoglycerate mutase